LNIFTRSLAALCLVITAANALAGKTAGTHVDDGVLHSKVKAELMADNFFRGMGINIEVSKGVVQLAGFVDNQKKADRAAESVAGVDGVVRLSNQLHVKSGERTAGQSIDDTVIATRVKAALGSDFSVNIDVYNGEVLLSGFVDNEKEKTAAIEAARKVDNVKKIISGIDITD
jgi:hyperosmotically inducible protein